MTYDEMLNGVIRRLEADLGPMSDDAKAYARSVIEQPGDRAAHEAHYAAQNKAMEEFLAQFGSK